MHDAHSRISSTTSDNANNYIYPYAGDQLFRELSQSFGRFGSFLLEELRMEYSAPPRRMPTVVRWSPPSASGIRNFHGPVSSFENLVFSLQSFSTTEKGCALLWQKNLQSSIDMDGRIVVQFWQSPVHALVGFKILRKTQVVCSLCPSDVWRQLQSRRLRS